MIASCLCHYQLLVMLVWFAAALQLSLPTVDSTPRPISQLVHTTWTAKDGAPTDIVDIGQTLDGYLWIGTRSGLLRFDGVRFVRFAPQSTDTVPSGGVRRLLGTRDGSLWIVWLGGAVSRVQRGRVRSYGEKDGLPVARQLAESSTGVLVAGTLNGLALFTGDRWTDVTRDWGFPGTESRGLWFDRDNALWAETEDRVVYRPAHSERFLDPSFRLHVRPEKADFTQASDGTVWMSELSRSAHTVPRIGDSLPVTEVMVGAWTVLNDRRGSLWIGTLGDGLRRVIDPTRIRGKKVDRFGKAAEQFTQKDGLLSDNVYAIREDREGNIWVGSPRGLERFREAAFTPTATPGLIRGRFVFASRDSSVWTGAENGYEIVRLRLGRQETIPTDSQHLTNMLEDSSGALWTIDAYKRLVQFNGRQFVPRRLAGADAQQIADLAVDRDGGLWAVADPLGIARVRHDSLIHVAAIPPPRLTPTRLFSDREGRLWVAQANRVALFDHGSLRIFGPADGVETGMVSGVYEDRANNIWLASSAGLSRFDHGRFKRLIGRGLTRGQPVYGVVEDGTGAWWVATDTAVLRLPPGELDRALADSAYPARSRTFDVLDGLPGSHINDAAGRVITRSADGRIWVATDSGVASIDPRALPVERAPTVLIEVIRSNGRELARSEAVEIPPNNRDVEIDYTATSLSIPERVQFRYRLKGEDPTWRDVGGRRRAYYTRLAPGAHRFEVEASNGDGVWNDAGTVLSFRVLPAWYQTLWFRTTVVLLIGSLGAAAAVLVQRRRHLSAQETLKSLYEATLAERARIAQDLHDTLLQGFAGVTLQLKTAELALPEQPAVAAETLLRVQRLARESLREARERVWDMRETAPLRDDLPAALESIVRERTAGTGIEVSTTVRGQRRRLTRAMEDAAFRIGREAVVNAVRHAAPHRIDIEIDFRATALYLEVRDDGIGFTPQDAEVARKNGHFGLSGVRERAARLGGVCDVRAGRHGGTSVALELPLAGPDAR